MCLNLFYFADVPFGRLDEVMQLIKKHLTGRIPDMLNKKDNQVFLDWLAGGQDKQVAMEREANARSNGALSVAARNLGSGGGGNAIVQSAQVVGTDPRDIEDAKILAQSFKDAAGSCGDLVVFKKQLLQVENEGHEQDLKRRRELIQVENEGHEQDLKRRKELAEAEAEALQLEAHGRLKAAAIEAEAMRKLAEARLAVAEMEERIRRLTAARSVLELPVPSAPPLPLQNNELEEASDHEEDPDIHLTLDEIKTKVSTSKVPTTLKELSKFFGGDRDAQINLNRFRKIQYEDILSERLTRYKHEEASPPGDSITRPYTLKKNLAETRQRIEHYCSLVFWSYASCTLLDLEKKQSILGPEFRTSAIESESTGLKNSAVNWSNLDDKFFGLPVDVDNIPEALEGDVDDEIEAITNLKPHLKTFKQRYRSMVWKLKVRVAELLCERVQSEIAKL